jgi:TonB-linked SusC/RagA family outer membrane protein
MLSSPLGGMSRVRRLVALTLVLAAPFAAAAAQGTGTGTIRGRVTDAATARAISDAQITITGTQLSAATTINGDFAIVNVPSGSREVVVRRLGYSRQARTVTVTSGGETRLDLTLSVTASTLEAIVVTGTAGAAEKRTLGNAVAQLDVSDLSTKSNVGNITDVLQARAPGVQIEAGSGTVGSASDIRIRGAGSFTLAQPIVYIDGVRMSTAGLGNFDPSGQGLAGNSGGQGANALDLLNPSDIESIEIVRGPAAATLYGADAANGVIQVITKKGARGQQNVQWSARLDYGKNDLGSVDFPNNYTTCDATKQAAKQADGTPLWPGCQGVAVNTILTQAAPILAFPGASRDGDVRRYSLNARGGGDRYNYFISGDHSLEEGVLFNNFDLRNSLRTNFSYSPDRRTDFQLSISAIDARLRQPLDGESAQGLLFGSNRQRPGLATVLPGQTVQGWPFVTPDQSNQYDNETHSNRMTVGSTFSYQPTTWFHHRLTAGLDWTYGLSTLFAPPNTPALTGDTLGLTAQRTPRTTLYTMDYSGSVDHSFGTAWSTVTSVGAQVVASRTETLFASGSGLGTPDVRLIGSTTTIRASDTLYASNSVGYYLQEQVGFKNRMYVTLADRVDNSSVFGSKIDVIHYPKAQVAYIVSEEPRFKSFFDKLQANSVKLRGAWGAAGKAPSPFAASRTYSINVVTLGTGSASALRTNAYGNPNLKPERGTETELGFDADLFKGRGGIELTWYSKQMRDVLVSTAIAPSTGFRGSQLANIGAVSNKGLEVGLNATPIQRRTFTWDSHLSISTNKNKLLSFGDTTIKYQIPFASYGSVQRHQVGYPLGGYWAPFPKRNPDGSLVLVNGAIAAASVTDTSYIGPAEPTHELAFSNTFGFFRNFSLYSLFDMKGGNYNYRGAELYRCASSVNCIERNDPNASAEDQIIYAAGTTFNPRAIYIHKADFVKLRDLSLTYELPERLASRIQASRAAITFAGHNLKLWSDYPGPDPEVNTYGRASAVTGSFIRGDIYAMPMTRRLSATLNLTF